MADTTEPTIYNRIAAARAERGISRQELANALGINYQELGYMERGDFPPSLGLAFRMSEFLGVAIEEIFSTRPFESPRGRLI